LQPSSLQPRGQALDELLSECEDGWAESPTSSRPRVSSDPVPLVSAPPAGCVDQVKTLPSPLPSAPLASAPVRPIQVESAASAPILPPQIAAAAVVVPPAPALPGAMPREIGEAAPSTPHAMTRDVRDDSSCDATVPPVAVAHSESLLPPEALELQLAMRKNRARARAVVFAAMLSLPAVAWLAARFGADEAPASAQAIAARIAMDDRAAVASISPDTAPQASSAAAPSPGPREIRLDEQVLGDPGKSAPSADGQGVIDVAAKGRCRFFVDGKLSGEIDWRLRVEVAPGVHEIGCSLIGGGHSAQTVRIAPGERKVVFF
jgi:hypothetical protein